MSEERVLCDLEDPTEQEVLEPAGHQTRKKNYGKRVVGPWVAVVYNQKKKCASSSFRTALG